ncbi:MAG TPA: MCE family protein [Actinomycetota bacterium]|nr:MCE family protein [Actinomycetota bacterium]
MRNTGIKLVVFTLFTVFITFYLASIIGNLSPFKDVYSVNAVFSDATGLLNGDPVKIAGVTVGKVTGFQVERGQAIVTIEVEADVELPENVIADIKYRNLLGQRTINLVRPESPSTEPLTEGETIPVENTKPALDLALVFNNLRPLIQSTNPEDINAVARAVLKVFKGREDDFAATLGNIGAITQTLADRDQRLARLVTDLNDLTQVLNSQKGNIRVSLDRFTELMESLADATPTIERVVDQLDDASGRFGGLIARNRSNLDQELADLNVLLTIVDENLRPLDTATKNLKEVLLATARSQSYGKWWTLYVVNLCPELPVEQCAGLVDGLP